MSPYFFLGIRIKRCVTTPLSVKEMGLWAQMHLACEDHLTGSESGYAGSGRNPNLISFLIQRAALRCTLKAS